VQGAGDATSVFIVVFVFAAAFTGLFVFTKAVQKVQEQVAENLAKSAAELRWSIARVGQVLWFQQKKLARALHGPVQSSITAAAIRMDAVVRAGGDPVPLLAEVRASIIDSLGLLSATPDSVTSLQLSIDRLIGTWEGVARVQAGIDQDACALLMADPVAETCVADALNEAVSNAVRHGGADRVDVFIDRRLATTDGVVILRVEDHGPAPIDHTKKGLGSQILDETSVAWSLDQLDEGHILNAEFPVSVG
jgi:signal transduction histidine kinase